MKGSRRVLVTGGTSAIGRATAERLAAQGDRVAITGRNHERGAAIAETTGGIFIPGDVCESGAVNSIVRETKASLGGLDGLVLCTGVLHSARISQTRDADWDRVLEVNLVAPFLFAQACMPMLKDGGGAIVAIASGTALWTEMELGAYSISKRMLLWMSRMLAVEAALHGITVNAVCPGDTVAGMTSVTAEAMPRPPGAPPLPPLGRLTEPADVAAAVAFFLRADAAFCSGAALLVDGGMRAALRASKVRT